MNDLQKILANSMTIQELINSLSNENPEAKVIIHYRSNEYWGTEIADPITGIKTIKAHYSEHLGTIETIDNEDEYKYYSDKLIEVIAIGES